MNSPNPSAATSARADARGETAHAAARLPREQHDPREHDGDAEPLERARATALREVDGERHDGARRGDRRDDSHRADRHAAVERGEPDRAACARAERR